MLIIAHRGASADAPENTLAAFEKAVEDRADMVELDVRLCAGGEPVVFHDADLHRLGAMPGKIGDLSLEELKAVNLGGGQTIPELAEVLEAFCRKISINIEIKDAAAAVPVAWMVAQYSTGRKGAYPDFLISSFDREALRVFRKHQAGTRLGWVVCQTDPDYSGIKEEEGIYSIHQHIDCASAEWVRRVQADGLKVMIYTVNHKADILKMKSLGVDGIFTDFPGKARVATAEGQK